MVATYGQNEGCKTEKELLQIKTRVCVLKRKRQFIRTIFGGRGAQTKLKVEGYQVESKKNRFSSRGWTMTD